MWDVLSKDYDINLNGEHCYQRVIKSAQPGSVIVFHDSLKAQDRIRFALPKVMDHFIKMGYTFAALPEN